MEKNRDGKTEPKIILRPDWADVAVFNMGADEFRDYTQRVYAALDKLQFNHYYDIYNSVPAYRREAFLGICHTYIDCHPDYELAADNCRIYNRKK